MKLLRRPSETVTGVESESTETQQLMTAPVDGNQWRPSLCTVLSHDGMSSFNVGICVLKVKHAELLSSSHEKR